jgi:hypothetical protein
MFSSINLDVTAPSIWQEVANQQARVTPVQIATVSDKQHNDTVVKHTQADRLHTWNTERGPIQECGSRRWALNISNSNNPSNIHLNVDWW